MQPELSRRPEGPADKPMQWFPLRKSTSESLAVSMAGIKLGDRLLVVGCSDPVLIARLAVKTGLTGRAHAVDADEHTVTRAAEVALREGALVETSVSPFATLPLEAGAFDVAVVRDVLPQVGNEGRLPVLAEARRVLRAGGRCLVIDAAPRGFGALIRSSSANVDYVPILQAAGFKASRVLAERKGQIFAEAVNPTPNP
jgi:ubiquinone/menaquinone biosynthesis C-methylase UbiE